MNYMFVRLSVDDEQVLPTKDVRTPISDALFDRALEISSQRGLALRSVKNIRDLGGIKAGERTEKRGKLIRSAKLSELTEEDAKKLAGAGVKTIIDLRSEDEAEKAPDVNVEGFNVVCFPLPTLELTEYQKNIQEKFFLTDPGAEKAYYLTEYLSCINMKDLYTRILTEESAIESLKGIFGLLCSSDGGFLFHCSDGKDRTGIVAALILLALGASKKEYERRKSEARKLRAGAYTRSARGQRDFQRKRIPGEHAYREDDARRGGSYTYLLDIKRFRRS